MEKIDLENKVLTFNVDDIYALAVVRGDNESELIYVDINGDEVVVVKEDSSDLTTENWLSIPYYGENPDMNESNGLNYESIENMIDNRSMELL